MAADKDAQLAARIDGLNAVLNAEIKRLDQADEFIRDAIEVARREGERGQEKANEFRGALDDLGRTMATQREVEAFKEQYRAAHELLRGQVAELGRRFDVSVGRQAGMTGTAKMAAGVLSTILVAIGIYTAVQSTNNGNKIPDNLPTVTTVMTVTNPGP